MEALGTSNPGLRRPQTRPLEQRSAAPPTPEWRPVNSQPRCSLPEFVRGLSLIFNPSPSGWSVWPVRSACLPDRVRPPLDPLRVPLTELEDEGGGRGGQCCACPDLGAG